LLAKYSEALDEPLAETEAKEDFRELEEAVEKLAEKTLPETIKQVAEGKDFSPRCKSCGGRVHRKGQRETSLLTSWGTVQLAVQGWQCCAWGKKGHSQLPGLDSRGLSPRTLERVLDLSIRLPYRESQAALAIQGIELEVSHCERLTQGYGVTFQKQGYQTFQELAEQPLAQSQQPGAVKVVQADGLMVLEKDKPSKGLCEGREVKQVLIYPLDKPKERHSIARSDPDHFQTLAHGLLGHAQVQQEDTLMGLADGSAWIDNLFQELGVSVRQYAFLMSTMQRLTSIKSCTLWAGMKKNARRNGAVGAEVTSMLRSGSNTTSLTTLKSDSLGPPKLKRLSPILINTLTT
jgi:hypothetical protein